MRTKDEQQVGTDAPWMEWVRGTTYISGPGGSQTCTVRSPVTHILGCGPSRWHELRQAFPFRVKVPKVLVVTESLSAI